MADADGPYDAVVVGSGFGGSVTAHRLAEANWSVLVLERGKPYPPGSFGRSPREMGEALWDPAADRYGMFDIWSFSDVNAVTASGLGGGSLIYANVMLRKPEETFVASGPGDEAWPVTRADLEPHYDRVEAMQRPERYPFAVEPYASTPKTAALQQAAADLGMGFELPPLAVRFAADGDAPRPAVPLAADGNLHGAPRETCRLCGECDLGCNYGAKQTLDLTYLSRAKERGAEIRCLCEVTDIAAADGGGYTVRYVQHVDARDGHDPALLDPSTAAAGTVHARHVVLAAGTVGSTRLVLRNRINLPGLSDRVGDRFSSNGDLLTFARNCRTQDGAWRYMDMSRGPVITGRAFVDDADSPGGRGFSIEDAGCPAIGEWALHAFEVPEDVWRMRGTIVRRIWDKLRGDRDTNVSGEIANAFGTAHDSAAVLALLSMGRDVPGGRFHLDGDDLDLSWREEDSEVFFAEMRAKCREVAEAIGGEHAEAPWSHLVTVHALGGMPMGATAAEGAVDSYGNVFGHPGLHVADGAVVPGPVGPNPSFTIAALADRFADRMIEVGA